MYMIHSPNITSGNKKHPVRHLSLPQIALPFCTSEADVNADEGGHVNRPSHPEKARGDKAAMRAAALEPPPRRLTPFLTPIVRSRL